MAKQQAVVYGAGEKAVSVKRSLTEADISVSYFVVSEKEGNPTNLDGLPVLSVEEFLRFRKDGMLALTADPADGRSKDPVVYIAVPDSEQVPHTISWEGNVPTGKVILIDGNRQLKTTVKGNHVTVTLPQRMPNKPVALKFDVK